MLERVPNSVLFVLEVLETHGHEAFVVGGAVRDLLLGLTPKDFDVTTSATPAEVAQLFFNCDLVGAHFGVSLVKVDGLTIEVATFRTDGCYSDGRRPDGVELTTWVCKDVVRRDFTINALLLDRLGEVVDYVGGLQDLEDRLIHAVGDAGDRFTEDPVRMLRAVKFACKLDFGLHCDVTLACMGLGNHLHRVAKERVAKELGDILTSGNAVFGLAFLKMARLLPFILPELGILEKTEQNPKYHPEGNVWLHTMELLRQLPKGCSLTLALSALLHDVGKPATLAYKDGQPTFHGHEEVGAEIAETILRRLKFSNDVVEKVVSNVAQHMAFRNLPEMRKAKQLRFVRQEGFEELLELHRLDALAGSGNLSNYEFAQELLANTSEERIRPVRLITGFDLIGMGGTPGPRFKEVLEAIENLQLEGEVTNREQALDAARGLLEV